MMCPTCHGRGWLSRIQVPCPECHTAGYVWPKITPLSASAQPIAVADAAPPTFPPTLAVAPWADAAD